jgi:hypothetical protein
MGSVSSIAELRSDPERLLNGDGGHAELALLTSLRAVPAPAGAKALVWESLGVEIVGTSALTSSSWASTCWRGLLKTVAASKAVVAVPIVVASLGAGAAGAAGVLHYSSKPTLPSMSPSVLHTFKAQTPASSTPPAEPTATPIAAEDSEPLPSKPATRAAPWPLRDHLREESALLARARSELLSGNPRAAQATLFHMQAQFPNGALSQEREVLGIEALAARGNAAAAESNARTFIVEHPESPHAVQLLRRFME